MESLDLKELKNIVKGLLSETSCPVCFNTLRAPVRLCTNGHGVCATCRVALEHCPLCTEPFSASDSKSVLLNGMLDLLPHTCKFEGCEVLFKPGDDHETWCGYQRSGCRLRSCKWVGLGKDVLDHIKTNHENIIKSQTNSNWRIKKNTLDTFRCYYVNIPTGFAKDNFYWMIRDGNDSKFVVCFYFQPNGNIITTSCRMTLVLGGSTKSYSSTLTITPNTTESYFSNYMHFVLEEVESLANSEGYIPISLTMEHVEV